MTVLEDFYPDESLLWKMCEEIALYKRRSTWWNIMMLHFDRFRTEVGSDPCFQDNVKRLIYYSTPRSSAVASPLICTSSATTSLIEETNFFYQVTAPAKGLEHPFLTKLKRPNPGKSLKHCQMDVGKYEHN
jgi:hypothetical protein